MEKNERYTGKYNKTLINVEIVMAVDTTQNLSHCLPPIEKYPSYSKLINVSAWIGRFINNLRIKINQLDLKLYRHIDQEDSNWALLKWVQLLQHDSYPNDLLFAKQGISQHRRLIKHPVSLEGEILCINGRLSKCAFISDRTRNPIILDGNHYFVKLLVQKMHEDANHRGFQTVFNNFRLMFWMPK